VLGAAQRLLVALVSVLASLRLTRPAKPSSPSRPHRPVLSDGALLLSAAAAGWLIWCGVVAGALTARATVVVPPVSAAVKAESVKPDETRRVHALCATSSMGWLIHAMVGSFGGCGRRVKRVGFAA